MNSIIIRNSSSIVHNTILQIIQFQNLLITLDLAFFFDCLSFRTSLSKRVWTLTSPIVSLPLLLPVLSFTPLWVEDLDRSVTCLTSQTWLALNHTSSYSRVELTFQIILWTLCGLIHPWYHPMRRSRQNPNNLSLPVDFIWWRRKIKFHVIW